MYYVNKHGSSTAKVSVQTFTQVKAQLLLMCSHQLKLKKLKVLRSSNVIKLPSSMYIHGEWLMRDPNDPKLWG